MATKKQAVGVIKLPATLAGCADRLYKVRESRLTVQRSLEPMKKEEAALTNHLVDQLPVGEASGITGKFASVLIDEKPVATVEDWDDVYLHIAKQLIKIGPGASAKAKAARQEVFAIMGRSISQEAIKELWTDKKAVPGVGRIRVKTVSCTKKAAKR